MSGMNEKAFFSALKAKAPASLYLFYGEDEYTKELCLCHLLKVLNLPQEPTVLDGQSMELAQLQEACCFTGFFSEDKCVIVRSPAIDSMNAEASRDFYKILSEKPASTVLVLFSRYQEINPKKSTKWSKLLQFAEQNGMVVLCGEKSRAEAVSMIVRTAKGAGCNIEPLIAEELAERCLYNFQTQACELQKLCAYALEKNSGVITMDAVEHLTARQLDFSAFEIIRHLLANKLSAALRVLDAVLLQQAEPVMVCGALTASFLDIYRVKIIQASGRQPQLLQGSFGYKANDFKLRRAGYDAPKCSLRFVKNALQVLSRLDLALKSRRDDKRLLLERALVEIAQGGLQA